MPGEFEFIDKIKAKYSLDKVGDDCAVLPKDDKSDLLLTVDMLVEDIDFRLEWLTPELLGHKTLAVSLSDIAAMGGRPGWSMLSIGVPETLWNTDFLDRFYAGWFALASKYEVELVGGDVSISPDKLVLDSTVGGEVSKGRSILRSTANPGDAIFVSGVLGGAAAGLELLNRGTVDAENDAFGPNLIRRQLEPRPHVELGKLLNSQGITSSMIDVSDGLSSDLKHLCDQSHVGATLDADKIPVDENLGHYFAKERCFEMALNGGEDFELLFTVSKENISSILSFNVTHIGEVTANVGNIELISGVNSVRLEAKGYRHF